MSQTVDEYQMALETSIKDRVTLARNLTIGASLCLIIGLGMLYGVLHRFKWRINGANKLLYIVPDSIFQKTQEAKEIKMKAIRNKSPL